MLHILWMILKIILIAVGVILGLILLLLALVLFCPVRYRAEFCRSEEKTDGQARVSWLLRAVSVTAGYRNGETSLRIRIFGIPLDKLKGRKKGSRGQEKKNSGEADKPAAIQKAVREESDPPVFVQDAEETGPEESSPEERTSLWKKMTGFFRKLWGKIVRAVRFVLGIPAKIQRFFGKIALTFRQFYGKIDRWKTFLEDERTRSGIRLGLAELKKLLRHAGPRKISGHLLIGMENPAATGELLALLGATSAIHKNCVAVEPVFDRKVLEADVQTKGRIYLIIVLIAGIRLYFDKNIKFIMKEFK